MKRKTISTAPHSVEAEESLIACLLIDGEDTIDRAEQAGVSPDSFYDPSMRAIWIIGLGLNSSRKAIDDVIVCEELKKQGMLEMVGGVVAINSLTNRIPTAAHRAYFIETVRSCEIRRKLISAATEVIEKCQSDTSDGSGLLDLAQSKFVSLNEAKASDGAESIDSVVDVVGLAIKEMLEGGGIQSGVKTGFVDIDNLIFGLQPGEMTILAARPSCGKTQLALDIVKNASNPANPKCVNTLFYSLEMKKDALGLRMVTGAARVRSDYIKSGRIGGDASAIDRLRHACGDLKRYKIFIDDASFQTVNTIRAKARSLHTRLKDSGGIGLIVVDYLGLVKPTDQKAPREQQVAEISRELKGLAKELNVPVLVLCQLNRQSEAQRRRPRLSDLRESGSIEQDADVVMFLSPEDVKSENARQTATPEMVLDIAKQRNGAVGEVRLTFLLDISRFENSTKF